MAATNTETATANGLTAAGTTPATATVLNSLYDVQIVTTCAAGANGVIIPAAVGQGRKLTIRNDGAAALAVYPQTNAVINSLAASAALSVNPGQSVTLCCYDGFNWKSVGVSGSASGSGRVVDPGATRAITLAESGSLFTVSAAAARVYTLPAIAGSAGTTYRFMITTAGANTVTIRAASACQIGQVVYGAGAPTAVSGINLTSSTDLVFAANQLIGSWAEYISTGTNWVVSGQSTIATGFTVA